MRDAADVVVVGAGIVGWAAAEAIAGRGARVILVDKEPGAAREGSGRAQGSLRVQGRHHIELAYAREALELWRAAAEEAEIGFSAGGNIYLATRPEEIAMLSGLVDEAHAAGLATVELLEPAAAREIIPAATGPFLGAMWSPIDAQCQPSKATLHFERRGLQAGVTPRYGHKALALLPAGGVRTDHGTIAAGATVVAAGAWTHHLAATAGLRVPLMPVIMSELETAPTAPLFAPTLRAFGFGTLQRADGRLVVSAGVNARVAHRVSLSDRHGLRYWLPRGIAFRHQLRLGLDVGQLARQIRHRSTLGPELVPDTSPEPPVDRPLVDASLQRLAGVFPELASARAERYWGGLLDMTPDGLPIIDRLGPHTIVAGLCGHGFTLGPVLGLIAAELALDHASQRPIGEFRLARFDGHVERPRVMI